MDYLDPSQAEWALQNPSTPGEALAAIAQAHPGLRDRVATHPNAYPQLVEWIAAQPPSAGSAASGAPQAYDPAQSYGPAQPSGPAQPYAPQSHGAAQSPPYAPGQPGQPYAPGGYQAGPPAKKKTGLILGLVGGGVFAVVLVVVLGLFVFHWFGDSAGPTLTAKQAKSFLDSDFMQDLSDGKSADDYQHTRYSASRLEVLDLPPSCQGVVDLITGADAWSSWSASMAVQRYPKNISPDAFIDAVARCDSDDVTVEDLDDVTINKQNGGWWVIDDDSVTLMYGNLWLALEEEMTDDEAKDLFDDFVAAVNQSAK